MVKKDGVNFYKQPHLQSIPGLLSTVAAACKPVFEVLRIDQIKGRSQQNVNHIGGAC